MIIIIAIYNYDMSNIKDNDYKKGIIIYSSDSLIWYTKLAVYQFNNNKIYNSY